MMDATMHQCYSKETCSLRELMRDRSYRLMFGVPQVTLSTPVTVYGAVTASNNVIANCGDFVKIHEGVSNIFVT